MSAVVDFPVKPEARPYLDAARGMAGEPDWLARQRRRALARFAEQGFPSRRGEAWRYLDLRPLEQAPLLPAGVGAADRSGGAAARLAEFGVAGAAARLVLVDGCFSPGLSAMAPGCRRASGSVSISGGGRRAAAIWSRPRSKRCRATAISPLPH